MRFRHVLVAMAVGIITFTGPAAVAAVGGPVGSIPATWTPTIATSGTDGSVEQVRQLVQCGQTMYAVGTFSQIKRGTTVYNRENAFSFSATTGAVTGWNPTPNAGVETIALSADCATAYLGGRFTAIKGTTAGRIAAVSTSTGAVRGEFAHAANNQVNTLVRTPNGHLLAGGIFTSINGSTANPYLASLNPKTGADDGYVNLRISGNYVYTDSSGRPSAVNSTRIYNTALSPDGTRLLVMGTFTSVGGVPRRQIFMANLGATSAGVNPWRSPEFNINCSVSHPFWLKDAAWSPDGTKVFTATTGYKPATGLGSRTTDARAGLCDAAASFPATATAVTHTWINYTGCDSLYSAAADGSAAYFGGHQRWANNPAGCDAAGPGAVAAPGLVGLSSATGQIVANPTRGKGQGATDMLVTQAGLWIASDNAFGSNACGKTSTGNSATGRTGICFLPY